MTEAKWAFEVPGKLEIPYRYFAGAFCSQWFRALRDRKKILGCRCPSCRKVFVPPRGNCERCLTKIDEWVELPGTGQVESFTVVRYAEPFQPKRPPYVLAAIRLDGADTSLVHLLGGIAPEQVQIGLAVEPVFAQERKGRITDIVHFRPLPKAKPKVGYQKPRVKRVVKKTRAKVKAQPKRKAKPKAAKKPAGKKTIPKTAARKPPIGVRAKAGKKTQTAGKKPGRPSSSKSRKRR